MKDWQFGYPVVSVQPGKRLSEGPKHPLLENKLIQGKSRSDTSQIILKILVTV